MSDKTDLGNRMKNYEKAYSQQLPCRLPIVIRLDGKAFHTYTKSLKQKGKVYDVPLQEVMNDTAVKLCEEIQGVKLAYVQSDEISLFLHNYTGLNTQPWMQNKIPKMLSVSAAIASATFTLHSIKIWKDYQKPAYFDSRVFILPEDELCNYYIWRQKDCIRNSIQTLARAYFSHKECNNKNTKQLKDLCKSINIEWGELPNAFKFGRCIVKEKYIKNDTERTRWVVDNNIPKFTENRDYINKLLTVETNEVL